MKLEDKEIFDINNKLISLREAKFVLSKEAKKEIPLNKKQAFILFCFTIIFFSVFYYHSFLVFSYLNFVIDTSANYRLSPFSLLGSSFAIATLLSLFIYPLFANYEEFQKRFNHIYSFFETAFICFSVSILFSMFFGVFYYFTIGSLLFTLKENFDFNLQESNNWFLGIASLSIMAFYLKNNVPFVKDNSVQQQYIKKKEKKLLPDIKLIENEEAVLRQKIISSVTNIDELAYFKHFILNSNVVEVARYQKVIEEKILKNSPYNSFDEYEKDMINERLNNNNNNIINN